MTSVNELSEIAKSIKNLQSRTAQRLRGGKIIQFPLPDLVKIKPGEDLADLANQTFHDFQLLSKLSQDEKLHLLVKPVSNPYQSPKGNTRRSETEDSRQSRIQAIKALSGDPVFMQLKDQFETAAAAVVDFLKDRIPPIVSKIEFKIGRK